MHLSNTVKASPNALQETRARGRYTEHRTMPLMGLADPVRLTRLAGLKSERETDAHESMKAARNQFLSIICDRCLLVQ
jgi:hypothetical protein